MKKLMTSAIAVALALFCCTSTIFANGTNEVINLTNMESRVLDDSLTIHDVYLGQTRATTPINWTISANEINRAKNTFPMEAGETVTINCNYSPRSASVEFGLVDSNDRFYHTSGSQGSINCTITIEKRGDYRFAVFNNSSITVSVTGFIEY